MEGIDFVKALEPGKVYLVGFDSIKWDAEQIGQFLEYTKEAGLTVIGLHSDGVQFMEPIGVDRDKLKQLFNV